MNPLLKLAEYGQSYWLENLGRDALQTGALLRRVRHEGLRGVTSNTRAFCDSVVQNPLYDRDIAKLAAAGLSAEQMAEGLAVGDVRDACDVLRPAYDAAEGQDGFVNLELSPRLAHDAEASIIAARRLVEQVARSNLMIQVPGTRAGIAAFEQLTFEGINVNVTLLFSVNRYSELAEAYLRALERRRQEGKSLRYVSCVASFSLGRTDQLVDRLLSHHLPAGSGTREPEVLLPFGKVAIANAKLAYEKLRKRLDEPRWLELARDGARVQRLLWASTSPQDPKYRDVAYVEQLIGPFTVTALSEATITAFADHGKVRATAEQDCDEARETLATLERLGIDFEAVAAQLESEGVQELLEPHAELVDHLERVQSKTIARSRVASLRDVATNLRRDVIRMTTEAGSGHPTSCLSAADLVACLFFHRMRWTPADPAARNVDQFVLSKGHAAPLLWAALSEAGAIDENPLTLRKFHSTLEGHPTPRNPWIRVATGSLGQGLSFANGLALANRIDGIDAAKVYCLMGDGECSEGSVWEAAQFTALNRLSNVVALVDVNGLGQSGLAPYRGDTQVLEQRFRAFGWTTAVFDGHDIGEILEALSGAERGGPTALIARTVKGKGVSFLEGEPGWHGKPLGTADMRRALEELGQARCKVAVVPRRAGHFTAPEPARERPRIDVHYDAGARVATRTGFGAALKKLGALHPELLVLDADVKDSTREDYFASRFPERFFQCYIAEQNMVGVALGLAKSGKLPVAGSFACFLLRAADFVRTAAHSRPEHLVLFGSHAGVSVGADGPSQMGLEDLAMFRAIRGSTVLYPSDAVSAERLAEEAVRTPGIVYVRTTRPDTPVLYRDDEPFPVGGSKVLRSSTEDQLTIVGAGITVHEALAAYESLRERRISARVLDAYSVKPIDIDALRRAALETGRILVVEDHAPEGGLGEAVSSALSGLCPVHHLAVTGAPRSGTTAELLESQGISDEAIVEAALALALGADGTPPSRRSTKRDAESEPPPAERIANG